MALLQQVVRAMDRLAPLALAERKWDNVGVLVEAPLPRLRATRVLLTIDLTEPVLQEALDDLQIGVIVAYHPALFSPFKTLTLTDTRQRIAAKCIAAGISVYSPHTALDNVPGGINDWLCAGLGRGSVSTISPADSTLIASLYGSRFTEFAAECTTATPSTTAPLSATSPSASYAPALSAAGRASIASLRRFPNALENTPTPGAGRVFSFDDENGISFAQLVDRVKTHLGLAHVRVAVALPHQEGGLNVRSVAVCAGSGSSVLKGVDADVYLTGEMSHHDVLEAVATGTSVILCEHSNTERGYLETLRANLVDIFTNERELCPLDASVVISKLDKDPLQVI